MKIPASRLDVVFESILRQEMSKAVASATRTTLEKAKDQSRGPYSSRELARRDHPFATRHPSPLLDPAIINEQSGAFLAAWNAASSGLKGKVWNDSFVTQFFGGTIFTRPRPIHDAIAIFARMALDDEIEKGWERVTRRLG